MDVALTVDVENPDRPCAPGNFGPLMEMFRDEAVTATLFVNGQWVLGAAEADVDAIRSSGMLVGLHSYDHCEFTSLRGGDIRNQLDKADAALRTAKIEPTRPLFRLPYLDGASDQYVLDTVVRHGWRHVHYQAGGDDWKPENRHNAAAVADKVIVDIEKARAVGRTTAIVLSHSWSDPTREALRQVVDHGRQRGDTFVSVLALPRDAWGLRSPE